MFLPVHGQHTTGDTRFVYPRRIEDGDGASGSPAIMNEWMVALALLLLAAAVLLISWNRALRARVKQQAQALDRANQTLRTVLDNTPNVAVQWFDRDGCVRYWNPTSAAMFGWTESEALGRTLGEIGVYTSLQSADFIDAVREVIDTGRALEPAESSFHRKGGASGVTLSTLFRIPGAAGESLAMCMDIDVTERLRSEERLRATLDHTPGVAIQWFDQDARVLYWNPASEMLYGVDAEEAMGRRLDELIGTPAYYAGFVAFLRGLAGGGVASGVTEATVRGRHGLDVTVLRRACRMPGDGPVYVCMEVDITDAQAAEREREQLNAVLSRVTETIPVCLSYLDVLGRYVWTNERNADRLATRPDKLIGRLVHAAQPGRADTPEGAALRAALGGKPQYHEREWPGVDGEPRLYDRFLVPDADENGFVRGCTSVWLDITARKEAEQRIRRLNRVYSVLSNINAALVRIKNRHALFGEACRIAVEHGGFGIVWVGLVDQATQAVQTLSWWGTDATDFLAFENAPPGEGVVGEGLLARCIRDQRPMFDNDISAGDPPPGSRRRRAVELGYHSAIVLPLIVNREVVGLFGMMAKEKNFFTEEEVRLLNDLSGDVAFALEVIDKENRINYLAYYDSLTGLPNTTLLGERLGQLLVTAAQHKARAAVVMVDVRRFRFINESAGRLAGDNALRELAQRLRAAWREPDNIGRLAGDCFALVLSSYGSAADLALEIERIITDTVKVPFAFDGSEFMLSLAAGIALYPDDGIDGDTLLRNAAAALKQAKSAAEPYVIYQPQMNARMTETLRIENRMRRALERGQFVLHYQPKVKIANGHLAGFEALIRWNDPESGLVPPGEFIPVLEETGMIVAAGQWAMHRVLSDHAAWREQALSPPRIAVNVSAVQLRRRDFADQVGELVRQFGAQALDLEITESLLMDDVEGCIAKLRHLRDLGVNIAIDDFGTGYSSLAYLSRLPVDALKIDRSFIHGMLQNRENMSIVSSIVSLAHALKIKVIAEGVETREQLEVLQSLACDEVQGYLISVPIGAASVVNLLRERTPLALV